jgi:hypothetical protein
MNWTDAVRVGDPDCTPVDLDDSNVCNGWNGRWYCTLAKHDAGTHIAGDGIEVVAVWQ